MSAPSSSSGVLGKDRAKTVPTIRASGAAKTDSGSASITIAISNTVQVDDWVLFFIGGNSDVCSTPTGLTKEFTSQIGDSANQPYIIVYSRRIAVGDVASDLGATFTFTYGASDGICGGYIAFANAQGFGLRPVSTFESQTDTANSHNPVPPAVYMDPSALYVGVAANIPYLSSGTAAAALTASPTSTTITWQTTALRSGGTGATVRGLAAWSGASRAAQAESLTYSAAQQWCSMAVFTVAPVSPHIVANDIGPAGVTGPIYNYSNSSGSCVVYSSSDISRGCVTYRPWPERIMGAYGTPDRNANFALGGARAGDITTAAFGTASYTSVRAGSGNAAGQTNQYLPKVLTQTGLTNRLTALYLNQSNGNDFLATGAGAGVGSASPPATANQCLDGARNSQHALYRLIRAASVFNTVSGNTGGATFDASFAAATSDGYSGGAAQTTTTPGGKVTIPLTSVDAIDIVVIATDNQASGAGGLGGTGAPYVVKVDGVTVTPTEAPNLSATGTTHNQFFNSGVYNNYKFVQKVISLTGIGAGSHTVTIEHAGASGNTFTYQGYMIPSATPPWIVAQQIWNLPDITLTTGWANYATAAIGQTARGQFNQITRDIAASFPDGKVIVYDSDASGIWSTATHVSAGDSLHPSEIGHALISREILRSLNERMAAPSSAFTRPTSLSPTGSPATFTAIGTRDYTVVSGQNAFAIETEGGGGGGGGGAIGLQGRGGGGGAYAKKNTFTFTAGAVLTITVGAGGTATPGAAGGNGGASQVVYKSGPDFTAGTVLCKADFGTGGAPSTGAVGTGGLATNCVGDVKTAGSNGVTTTGGAGAAPLGGAGGAVGGNAGSAYGGGGGGGNAGSTNAGGIGASGVVKFS